MSGSTISGVSSGIDWKSTIDALMQIEGRRVTLIENRQTVQQQRLDAWRNINTKLSAFESTMDDMQDLEGFLTLSASSADQDVIQATANAGAASGSYDVLVDQLATSSRLIHQGWADVNTTAINTSGSDQVFTYTYGTGDDLETISVDVADGSTLTELVSLINNDDSNPGIQATILNDGSESATAYHLVLTSEETGESSTITIDDALTTLGATGSEFDTASIEQSQTGQNARIRVDGYPSSSWIESETNTVEEVISGVTLSLQNVSDGDEIRVTINTDKTGVEDKISSFVNSYNEIMSLIDTYSSYDDDNEVMGILLGDGSLSQLERELNNIATRPLTGLSSALPFSTLAEIGITSGDGGRLSIDTEKLDTALEENFNDVGSLFTFNSRSTSSHISFFTRQDGVPAGDVDVSLNYNAAGELTSATLNGEAADVSGSFVVAAEGSELEGLRLRFTDPGDGGGTLDATVTLGYGVASAFQQSLSSLTDPDNGLIYFQTSRLEDSVENLSERIEDMNDRLDMVRAQYEREYLAMETQINRLQNQAGALNSLG